MKWRIMVDLSYMDRDTTIKEFERIVADLKEKNYPKCGSGSGTNRFSVEGPQSRPLSDTEIEAVRELLIKKDAA